MENTEKNLQKGVSKTLEQINLNAAGIDIGKFEIFVCVPEERDEKPIRSFPAFTDDLEEIANWLRACNVDTAAMESTGVYWIPLYDILEKSGIKVYLVDAGRIKNVPGRKSDVVDCHWIQKLHTYGLLSSSFIADKKIRKIRELVRHREKMIESKSTHILRMQKQLEIMNLKLTNVISDITGATGMQIISASGSAFVAVSIPIPIATPTPMHASAQGSSFTHFRKTQSCRSLWIVAAKRV